MIPEIIEFWRNDGVPTVNIPHDVEMSKGTGFDWGYRGLGPMELAINVLAQFVTTPEAIRLHVDFMRDHISNIPYEGGSIPRDVIGRWIAAHS